MTRQALARLVLRKPAAGRGLIVVAPTGGLCNRMRALDAALALAGASGSELRMLWYRSPNINCSFEDLFRVPAALDGIAELDLYRPSGRMLRKLTKKFIRRRFDAFLTQPTMPAQRSLPGLARDGRRLFIETHRRFFDAEPFFSQFVPITSLQEIIEQTTGCLQGVVGVHVRRADNVWSSTHSPLERFVELMQAEREADPQIRFFVATDSSAVEHQLGEQFPGRVLTYPKQSLDRNDPQAIRDALVDLYCLSRCSKLIGSYRSSFSTTAWQLGGIDKVIAREGMVAT